MRVLVTGGAGFIGSHVCELLVSRGYEIIVVDNLVSGRMENIESIINTNKVHFKQLDICNMAKLDDCFDEVKAVIHLAGIADIIPSIEHPQEYFSVNVNGTLNVLECARKHNVERFIYAASSSCYGIPSEIPTSETAEIDPRYPYALTKYLGEQLLMHWGNVYQLPVVSLRLFNVYGPRVRTVGAYGAVFGVFLAQKVNGKPLTVVGDGNQSRDFTYVSDVANAFVIAMESNVQSEIMNVGSGNHYTINRLTELIGGDVVYVPKRPGEPDITFANTDKIKQLLGWSAKTSFEKGVETMLSEIDVWKEAPLWTPELIEDATRTWFTYLGSEKNVNKHNTKRAV